ncbi:MAG: leucine--tRNA ligase, partial [Thermoprotei archaeon]
MNSATNTEDREAKPVPGHVLAKLKETEAHARRIWDERQPYTAKPIHSKPKKFATFPYPYMNSSLHVGHVYTISRVDAYARFWRLKGYNVLFPFAWHWTGEPIVGTAKRVAEGDRELINTLTKLDGVPEQEIPLFTDPEHVAAYFSAAGKQALKLMGASIDWSREFATAHNPEYSAFVTWQFNTLREKGYVTRGTHPVVWCPYDKSPTGDHDRKQGEGVSPDELFLVEFPVEGNYAYSGARLVAATYRPETLFGATNLWVNPEGQYVEAQVDAQTWIVSEQCAAVLPEQRHTVKVTRKIAGRELLGLSVRNPLSAQSLPVYPAPFVDTAFGTGVVYSVPAHAPYDYLALKELQQKDDDTLRGFGLNPSEVRAVKPVSIISVPGAGEFPAAEEVGKLNVTATSDPKADTATQNVYKLENSKGVLKDNCAPFSGLSVRDAKPAVFKALQEKGMGATYLELPEPVVCRCGTRCVVKILENQWFLKYSDPAWKRRVLDALNMMRLYPEESRQLYLDTIEWLQDKACARRSGMGTPLPWDREWIVETLSDSTVYMAYYTLAGYVNSGKITARNMIKEFFDYVFYGQGGLDEVARKVGLPAELLSEVRAEFLYWYPVDLRNSGKELIPNHLTFFLFHHCALFEEKHWPKGISVNGMVTADGRPMHKRFGNYVPMFAAVNEYGADVARCALLGSTEAMDDPDWNMRTVRATADNLYSFAELVEHCAATQKEQPPGNTDSTKWLRTKFKKRAGEVAENMENMKTRSAFNSAFYGVWDDLRRHWKRTLQPERRVDSEFVLEWVKLIHPFAPH